MNVKKGITLIALVVTIVILLILSGVAIAFVVGPDGLIEKANLSKLASRYGQIRDRVDIRETRRIIADKTNTTIETNDIFVETLINQGLFIEGEDVYEDNKLKIGKIKNTVDQYHYIISLFNENSNKADMIVIAGVKEDKGLSVNIAFMNCLGLKVDWGDENITEITTNEITNLEHTYVTEGNYEVNISGNIDSIEGLIGLSLDHFTKIIQWGENGFYGIIANFSEQIEIPLPTEKSFRNLQVCDSLFANSNIISIPENLFSNALNLKNVSNLFYQCTNLESIPLTLFDNCLNINNFSETFAYCTNLTGNAPELWTKFTDIDSEGCFYNCNGLENFDQIPEHWIKYGVYGMVFK